MIGDTCKLLERACLHGKGHGRLRADYGRVPAADAKISQQAMDETFYLSNIAPQVGDGFNRHYWAYLEDFCRRLTSNFEDVYIFTYVTSSLPRTRPRKDQADI